MLCLSEALTYSVRSMANTHRYCNMQYGYGRFQVSVDLVYAIDVAQFSLCFRTVC